MSFRHVLNEGLLIEGGQIGYCIRPNEWGAGSARSMHATGNLTLGMTAGLLVCLAHPVFAESIDLARRRELFIDNHLIGEMKNVQILVHQPEPREIAVQCDAPWEGNGCGYYTVLHDARESVYRMYYHAWQIPTGIEPGGPLSIAYFESKDGITWVRPSLGLCEFNGSKENNIILDKMGDGSGCHDFSPFIDENPAAAPEARYKATGAGAETGKGVWIYQSPDGIHWTPMADAPVFSNGAFDSQNVSFWSEAERQYVLYYRTFSQGNFKGTRRVNRAVSKDYLHWTEEGAITFPDGEGPQPLAQFYINQIKPYSRAPHLYIGFPARYVDHGFTESTKLLPEWDLREKRMSVSPRYGTAVTDSVYITSRDGKSFRQSNDVFLRPGLRTRHNWSYGDNYIAWHVVETQSARDDSPRELSLYATESYFTGRDSRLRRYALRIDGFASVHAKLQEGEFTTKPITFSGHELSLNAATSAAGRIQVEIREPGGTPIPGFTLDECDPIYGDALDRRVSWKGNRSVAAHRGNPVVVRFVLREADIYSLAFE
ncbi:MAG: hypothetical protein HUU16_13405 [Candidatus Omnitrophica bacterium]|nr:hypothetical protein [Candidatus Omnitrophota bacterium]